MSRARRQSPAAFDRRCIPGGLRCSAEHPVRGPPGPQLPMPIRTLARPATAAPGHAGATPVRVRHVTSPRAPRPAPCRRYVGELYAARRTAGNAGRRRPAVLSNPEMSLKRRHVSRGTGILARAAVSRRTLTDIIFHGGDEGLWARSISTPATRSSTGSSLWMAVGAVRNRVLCGFAQRLWARCLRPWERRRPWPPALALATVRSGSAGSGLSRGVMAPVVPTLRDRVPVHAPEDRGLSRGVTAPGCAHRNLVTAPALPDRAGPLVLCHGPGLLSRRLRHAS